MIARDLARWLLRWLACWSPGVVLAEFTLAHRDASPNALFWIGFGVWAAKRVTEQGGSRAAAALAAVLCAWAAAGLLVVAQALRYAAIRGPAPFRPTPGFALVVAGLVGAAAYVQAVIVERRPHPALGTRRRRAPAA